MAKAHVKYPVSMAEQALYSLLNFGVSILLLRYVPPESFGAFFFWVSCGYILFSVLNGLAITHFQVLAPGDITRGPRLEVERLMHMVTGIFLLVVGILTFAAKALFSGGAWMIALAPALFLPAFLLQNYVRLLVFSRAQPLTALIQTAATLIIIVAILLWLKATGSLSTETALLAHAFGYGGVGLVSAFLAMRGQFENVHWRELKAYSAYARQSGWILISLTSIEIMARFYAFAVIGRYGEAALASLSATQQLLRPLPMLAASLTAVEKTEMAKRRDAGDFTGIGKVTLGICLIGAAVSMVWSLLVFFSWPWVARMLFDGKYTHDGAMVLMWGLVSAISFGQIVLTATLQALRAFKPLALVNLGAALITAVAVLMTMSMPWHGGAILGTTVGQAIALIAMILLLKAWVKRLSAPL